MKHPQLANSNNQVINDIGTGSTAHTINANTNNKKSFAVAVNGGKNVAVVRNNGGNKVVQSASKSKDRKKEREKRNEGELSLAAALSRVGIMPPTSERPERGSGRRGSFMSWLAAAEKETVTEIKTLYKFRYRAK